MIRCKYCWMVVDVSDQYELPCAVFDFMVEVAEFLHLDVQTCYNAVNTKSILSGRYEILKVYY